MLYYILKKSINETSLERTGFFLVVITRVQKNCLKIYKEISTYNFSFKSLIVHFQRIVLN